LLVTVLPKAVRNLGLVSSCALSAERKINNADQTQFGDESPKLGLYIFRDCRNAVICLLRSWGCTNVAAALHEHAYQPRKLLAKLVLFEK
jgi:hypothetical protein